MNYQDFKLSQKRLDLVSMHLAKKKVEKYVKENGVEPPADIEATFYEVTPEEKERYRKAFFASDFVDTSDVRIDLPEVIENTPEEQEVEDEIVSELLAATGGTKTFTAETINNITIPAEVKATANITGDFQNGATIDAQNNKTLYINNTSEEPVDITILTQGTTVYLTGKFNNIYFNGKTLNGTGGAYPEVSGDLNLVPAATGNVTVSATFQESANVRYLGDAALRVNNYNNEEANVNVYAPNSTVTVNGKFDEVEATVSDETLILNYAFHCNTLKVNHGKVVYQGINQNDFFNEFIGEAEVVPYGFEVTGENIADTKGTPGVYPFAEDFSNNKPVVFGTFASGKYQYDWKGHQAAFGDSVRANFLIRGSATVDFVDTVGGGKMINNADSYGIWAAANDVVVNIYGGTYEAYTHVLYAEKGHINVYGGTFNCLSEDKTFTLNCFDSAYTAGNAVITVYGGRFYNFDPSHSMSEPGGPVSFVADGYKVVSSQIGDDTVYDVIPADQN